MQYLNYLREKFYLNCKQLDCHMIIANANSNEGLEGLEKRNKTKRLNGKIH